MYFILNGFYKGVFIKNFKRCNMKFKSKQLFNKYVEVFKLYLLILLYLVIFIILYLIYGSGDIYNNFIYNEF